MLKLICDSVLYYSQGDEASFFNWLNSIESVVKVQGFGTELEVTVSSNDIPDEELREFLAIFTRYGVHLKQLRIFENSNNAEWFTQNKVGCFHFVQHFSQQ
ncbi:hypothetical protein KO495_02915 [Colwellia sp. D2M02]|uniref:hypothetical protein n=1 Tax=Colwellia sp. D2M02 TaxID=2841562 RepID=UPI001C08E71E|nr:hypothetical protein [Colwellia sp. D2M02]MBU2892271.1 hypothetical protein [Colwellia sp. D2M02]